MLHDETLASKLIKKGFWLYFFTFLTAPTGYVIRVFISNDLSVSEIGIIYSMIGLIGLISMYNDLGMTESLGYFLPKYRIEKKFNDFKSIIYLTFIVQFISGILISGALYLGANWLAINYFHDIQSFGLIKMFCIYFIFLNIHQVLSAIFISFQDAFNSKFIEFTRMFFTMILTIFFFYSGLGDLINYGSLWIFSLIISVIISSIIFFTKYKNTLSEGKLHYDKKELKTFMKYALGVLLLANIGGIFFQIDQQMVMYFLGAEKAGYFANYQSLVNIVTTLIGPILGLIFPLTTELISKKQNWKLEMLQNILYKYITTFTLSIGMIMAVLGPELATIFFGTKFIYSGEILSYSSIFIVINILIILNFTIMAGKGQVKERIKSISITLVFSIILNLILIKILGMIGVIIATIIAYLILFIITFKTVNNDIKITFDYKYILKNIILLSILATIIFYFKSKIFKLDDMYRYQNLLYMFLIGGGYYLYFCTINYKEILLLKNEIMNLRK